MGFSVICSDLWKLVLLSVANGDGDVRRWVEMKQRNESPGVSPGQVIQYVRIFFDATGFFFNGPSLIDKN